MQRSVSTQLPDALPAGGPKVILSVDDEPGILYTRKHILIAAKYQVINAIDGEAALEVFDAVPNIDLVLLDFAMPGMDGGIVAREMKKRRPSVPICMVTAHEAMVAKMTPVCVDCIVPKGTGPVYLLEKINELLGATSAAPQRL